MRRDMAAFEGYVYIQGHIQFVMFAKEKESEERKNPLEQVKTNSERNTEK